MQLLKVVDAKSDHNFVIIRILPAFIRFNPVRTKEYLSDLKT